MRLEHHLVGGYVRYISPYIIIIIIMYSSFSCDRFRCQESKFIFVNVYCIKTPRLCKI